METHERIRNNDAMMVFSTESDLAQLLHRTGPVER
jgi:hypothetical protein